MVEVKIHVNFMEQIHEKGLISPADVFLGKINIDVQFQCNISHISPFTGIIPNKIQ